jgi:hypothetical protein
VHPGKVQENILGGPRAEATCTASASAISPGSFFANWPEVRFQAKTTITKTKKNASTAKMHQTAKCINCKNASTAHTFFCLGCRHVVVCHKKKQKVQ